MRAVFVDAARLERWVAGFEQRHPGVRAEVVSPQVGLAEQIELSAPDGSSAVLFPAFGPVTKLGPKTTPATAALALVADAQRVQVLRALLVRRGGYACAVLTDDTVTASKVGSRYVQGRTAAGGQSQHRYARRRDGQVQGLIESATEVAVRVLLPVSAWDGLVTGGDKALVDQVLADPRLQSLGRLRRGPHLEIGDPKFDLVKELPRRGRAIRILLDER